MYNFRQASQQRSVRGNSTSGMQTFQILGVDGIYKEVPLKSNPVNRISGFSDQSLTLPPGIYSRKQQISVPHLPILIVAISRALMQAPLHYRGLLNLVTSENNPIVDNKQW